MQLHVLACCLGLFLGASCGGGDGAAGDEARGADSINLRSSDLPEEWEASARGANGEANFRRCLGIEDETDKAVDRARSDDFSRKGAREATAVWSEASRYQGEDEARRAYDAYAEGLRGAAGERCSLAYVQRLLQARYGGELRTEAVSVVPLSGLSPAEVEMFGEPSFEPPHRVDSGGAWVVAVSFHVRGGRERPPTIEEDPPTAYVELVQLRERDLVGHVHTFSVSTPAPEALRDGLVSKLAGRMTE